MDVDLARDRLAQAARILHRLGFIDLMGHISLRLDTETCAVTPGFGPRTPPPGALQASDILIAHRSGRRISGPHLLPLELPLHFALYNENPAAGAVIVGSPPHSIATGIVGRQLDPITHSQAWMAHQGAPIIPPVGLVADTQRAEQVAAAIGRHPVAHLRGLATVFVANDLTAAMRMSDSYEYLARMNLLVAQLGRRPRIVSREDALEIDRSRSGGETIPSRDPHRYFASLDQSPHPMPTTPSDPVEAAKHAVALSCRILATQGSLVAFFEHVSQRLLDGDRFLMSPAKNFAHMTAADIGTVSLDDECVWLDGPYPPAPFRRYHRDLFRARPDVMSIVHTHEMFGRAFAMAEAELMPVFRVGAVWARNISTLERPTMAFSEDDREAAVELLGSEPAIQLLSHGTDFLATTLEEATVAAVQREHLARILHLASQLGEPAVLSDEVISEVVELGPDPEAWWRFYAVEAGPPGSPRLDDGEGALDQAGLGE